MITFIIVVLHAVFGHSHGWLSIVYVYWGSLLVLCFKRVSFDASLPLLRLFSNTSAMPSIHLKLRRNNAFRAQKRSIVALMDIRCSQRVCDHAFPPKIQMVLVSTHPQQRQNNAFRTRERKKAQKVASKSKGHNCCSPCGFTTGLSTMILTINKRSDITHALCWCV